MLGCFLRCHVFIGPCFYEYNVTTVTFIFGYDQTVPPDVVMVVQGGVDGTLGYIG